MMRRKETSLSQFLTQGKAKPVESTHPETPQETLAPEGGKWEHWSVTALQVQKAEAVRSGNDAIVP